MTEPQQSHRSRFAWPNRTDPTTTPAGTHDHGMRNGPLFAAYLCILLLFLAVCALAFFVYQQQQYVLGRGEYRDAEAEQMEEQSAERIREGICDLLEQLPPSALLDDVRAKYDCGPGRPIEDLPPEVRQELFGDTAAAPTVDEHAVPTPDNPPPPRTGLTIGNP